MSTLCWKLYYTFHSLVLATLKNSFNRISHSILFYSILFYIFAFHQLNLMISLIQEQINDMFENFDQILLTVT